MAAQAVVQQVEGSNPNRLRFKCIMFTSFKVDDFSYDKEKVTYIIYQKEKCPKTGRLHLQGYAELLQQYSLRQVKIIFNDNALHVEKRRGTQTQAIEYCTKEATRVDLPIEEGQKASQGARSDLVEAFDLVKSGASMHSVAEAHPTTYIRYNRGLEKVSMLYSVCSRKMRDLTVTVNWGVTGSGKTYSVYRDNAIEDIYKLVLHDSALWFDGYDNQDILLIDEFYGQVKISMLLQILDKYPLRLPTKGGHTYAGWSKVYITSNCHPDAWYSNVPDETKRALVRRISNIVEFNEAYVADK